jgi:hypothetical protein
MLVRFRLLIDATAFGRTERVQIGFYRIGYETLDNWSGAASKTHARPLVDKEGTAGHGGTGVAFAAQYHSMHRSRQKVYKAATSHRRGYWQR